MTEKLAAILWAQFRITRNHFPRTSLGTLLSWSVSFLWYLCFTVFGLLAARGVQHVPYEFLPLTLSLSLLALFVYMQFVPLITTSAGWSLQLDKLRVLPISDGMLFLIEVALRLTSSPEMLILLAGLALGLWLREGTPWLQPLWLISFVPFSLLLQLAIRDFILHRIARSRFRELLTIVLLAIALIPQILVRAGNFERLKPAFQFLTKSLFLPWREVALLSIGHSSWNQSAVPMLGVVCWNAGALWVARRQFTASLTDENNLRSAAAISVRQSKWDFASALTSRLREPLAALVQKELRSLARMPRFRIVFGMACIFSLLVFVPLSVQTGPASFMGRNLILCTSLYGMLLLSDALLLNFLGFDRGAAQLYFCTPLSFRSVILAKNTVAVFVVCAQSLLIPALALLFRVPLTLSSVSSGFLASAVMLVFLLTAGNLLSVYFPRPMDPRSSFRKQSGGQVQLWFFLVSLGMALLIGFAFLARWATDRDWTLFATMGFELAVGLVVYRIALDSAIARAGKAKEQITAQLSKNAAPLASD